MVRLIRILCLSTAALGAVSANAATLYSTGPVGGDGGITMNICCEITANFTLTRAATITGFTFGGWTTPGDVITSVTWGVSTMTDFAHSGTTPLLADNVLPNFGFDPEYPDEAYDVRVYSGTTAPLSLAAGSYWLTLANAVTANNDYAYWDAPGGSSTFYQSAYGNFFMGHGVSFTVTGEEAAEAVPEPASWAMMVGGFGLVGAGLRRRRTTIHFA